VRAESRDQVLEPPVRMLTNKLWTVSTCIYIYVCVCVVRGRLVRTNDDLQLNLSNRKLLRFCHFLGRTAKNHDHLHNSRCPNCIQAQNKGLVFKSLSYKSNSRCNEPSHSHGQRHHVTLILLDHVTHGCHHWVNDKAALSHYGHNLTCLCEHAESTTGVCPVAQRHKIQKLFILVFYWLCISVRLLLTTNWAHFL
jgi:hypothetical protein